MNDRFKIKKYLPIINDEERENGTYHVFDEVLILAKSDDDAITTMIYDETECTRMFKVEDKNSINMITYFEN